MLRAIKGNFGKLKNRLRNGNWIGALPAEIVHEAADLLKFVAEQKHREKTGS